MSRPNSTLPPPPLLHTRSSPASSQSFPVLRPPLTTTPTRDGRSRSTNNINSANAAPVKNDIMTFDNFNDTMIQKYEHSEEGADLELMILYILINMHD
jgi:hypothetical protein